MSTKTAQRPLVLVYLAPVYLIFLILTLFITTSPFILIVSSLSFAVWYLLPFLTLYGHCKSHYYRIYCHLRVTSRHLRMVVERTLWGTCNKNLPNNSFYISDSTFLSSFMSFYPHDQMSLLGASTQSCKMDMTPCFLCPMYRYIIHSICVWVKIWITCISWLSGWRRSWNRWSRWCRSGQCYHGWHTRRVFGNSLSVWAKYCRSVGQEGRYCFPWGRKEDWVKSLLLII